jgi:spermidine synthase
MQRSSHDAPGRNARSPSDSITRKRERAKTHRVTPALLARTAGPRSSQRALWLVAVLFFASGCAALIYEVVWLQLLQLTIGASAVSIAVLLGTFMGGLCLGSLALPRIVPSPTEQGPIPGWRHPLRVYALIETGVGILGIATWVAMPHISRIYAVNAVPGIPGILWRGVVCAVCLLFPTLLMGASLPAAARWVESSSRGAAWLGFFYGANTAGAVCGCLLAGFYLLRVYDMFTATVAAAILNFAVALAALAIAASSKRSTPAFSATARGPAQASRLWPVYAVIGLSGLSALGAEVVWTRMLSLIMGPTVYTFSIILGAFLVGIGLGSGVGSFLAPKLKTPFLALGWCQMLLVGAMAFAAYMISESLPYWQLDPAGFTDPWIKFRFDLVRCLCTITPAAILWGASFPLALASASRVGQDSGRLVGRIYAVNTFGAILGAIGFSVLLIPAVGTQNSERLLIALAASAGLIALAPVLRKLAARLALFASLASTAALIWVLPPLPWEVIAWGHHQLSPGLFSADLLSLGEGMNASVAVTRHNQVLSFHVNGKVEASSEPQDMRLQRMLGHIPAMLHPKPRSVLIVGCGAGVTAGSFVVQPGVERIVICEIEPLVPPLASEFFRRENHDVVRDPRTMIIPDDARHYILTTRDKFDIITSDPIHPWVRGSAPLYTREYFEICKRHLNPGGIVTQWVPLYQSTADAVKSEMATFFDAFPSGTIWSAEMTSRENDDVVLLGRREPSPIDIDALQQKLEQGEYSLAAESLREVGFRSAVDLLATYAGRGTDLRPWLSGAEINLDRNLRLQYLAGMGLNLQEADSIYSEMLHYRVFPEDLFTGPQNLRQILREALSASTK